MSVVLLGGGCGGGSTANDCDVPKLFEDKCAGAGCHSPGPSLAGELDLVSAGVEDRVSNQTGNNCAGILADPSNPTGSLLYEKVAGTPTCEARMPLNGDPLSEAEVTCIRDWISGLLPPQNMGPDAGEENVECLPEEARDCYDGPEETQGVGTCAVGVQGCVADGATWVWGPCEGQVLPRGENCLTADDENCDSFTPVCSELWSLGFGSYAMDQSTTTRGVAVDSSGNIYTLSHFLDTASFGGDPLTATGLKADIALAKFDHYGNPLWSKAFGDSSNQYSSDLVIDGENNIIVLVRAFGTINFGGIVLDGPGADDIAIAKLDSDGNHIWSRVFGGTDPDRAERVTVDSNGDVLVTGTFGSVVDFGGGPFSSAGLRDAFVLKLDGSTGAHLWSKHIGGAGDEYGFGVDVDAADNVFITGRFQGSVTIGTDDHDSRGGYDIYTAKLTPGGNYVFTRSYGTTGDDVSFDLIVHEPTGDFVITGYSSGTIDFGGGPRPGGGDKDIYLARFNNNAGHVWSGVYGDENDQFETSFDTNTWNGLEIDQDGNVYLGGPLAGSATFDTTTLTSAGRTDVLVVKMSPDGEFLSGARYGGMGTTELALGIALDSDGYVILGGRFFGSSLNLGIAGTVQRTGPDSSDGFVLRTLP